MTAQATNVFINCPFDEQFKPCFEAILFVVTSSGYRVRCALEESNTGDIRFDKLCRLIRESGKSVHDLSRVDLGDAGLPRFNMPFELGLYLGAYRFGGKSHQQKSSLIMVSTPYRLPVYLSDLAGNDPRAHNDRPEEIIRIIRAYLHTRPDGSHLPGAARVMSEFHRFKASLPDLAAALHIAPDELDAFRDYRDYLSLMVEFLKQA